MQPTVTTMIGGTPGRPCVPATREPEALYCPSGGAAVGGTDPTSGTVAEGAGVGSTVGLGVGVATAVGVYVGECSGAP